MNIVTNVAIIGAGKIGRLHAEVCSRIKNVFITAVVDLDEEKGKELADTYGAKFYKNLDELLKNENLNIVAICTPTFTHFKIVEKIADSGINIFCEKPLALTIEEADNIIKIVEKSRVKAMAGHVLRFWPEYCRVKEIIDKNELGKVFHVQCERLCAMHNDCKNNWKINEEKSGGAALDIQIHDLDFLIWLFGEPTLIKSLGIYNKSLGGCSHINTILKFKNNINGFINAGWDLAKGFPFTAILRVICENGVIEWIYRSTYGYNDKSKNFPLVVYKSDGLHYIEELNTIDPYYNEWEYFVDCVVNNKKIENSTFKDAKLSLYYALQTLEF